MGVTRHDILTRADVSCTRVVPECAGRPARCPKISTVNVMTMDYGDSAAPNPSGQMGTYAIDAAQSTFTQLGSLYGTAPSTSQLWGMVGVTPMIGVNDQSDEVFGFSDAKQLLAFAEKMGLGEIAMWSLARDQKDPAGALSYAEDNRARSCRRLLSFRLSSTR
jgi:hypothetical protein